MPVDQLENYHDRMHYLIDQIKTMPEFAGSSLLNKRINRLETFLGRAVQKSREVYHNDLEDIKDMKDNLILANKKCALLEGGKLVNWSNKKNTCAGSGH